MDEIPGWVSFFIGERGALGARRGLFLSGRSQRDPGLNARLFTPHFSHTISSRASIGPSLHRRLGPPVV